MRARQLYSHLYASDSALVGAFARIDLPLLPELQQFTYVLFTGRVGGLASAWALLT